MRRIWRLITGIKNAIGNIIFLGLLVLVVVVMVTRETVTLPESAILKLDPSGVLVEQKRSLDPFEQFLEAESSGDGETLLRDVTDAINLAREDDRIKALVLDLDTLQGGSLGAYEEIGTALTAFRESGKPILAYADDYSQSRYYLATFADELYLNADAQTTFGVFLTGLGAYPLYFKSALEKLRIKYHVFRSGLYKDAADIFLRDNMSDQSKEATSAYLSIIWDSYLTTLAENRGIDKSRLVNYIDRYEELLETTDLDPGLLAEEQGLVDARISRREWRERLAALTGNEQAETGEPSYDEIDFNQYLGEVRTSPAGADPEKDKIAVLVAKGIILDGELPVGDVGSDSIAELIRQAREDSSIKAVVLRVDSPGGSPSASEYIRRELQLTQESGKPVVASMGGLAASGGYWIAASADRIFAHESTLTGSIGVFASLPTFDASLSELGIHSDGVGTSELSDAFYLSRPLNPRFRRIIENSVAHTYRQFLNLVSEGRGLSLARVNEIAQGRVWAGRTAVELGLVDAIGTIDDAIESAAALTDIEDYDVVYLEKPLSPRERLLQQFLENVGARLPRIFPTATLPKIPPGLRALADLLAEGKEPVILSQCMNCKVYF